MKKQNKIYMLIITICFVFLIIGYSVGVRMSLEPLRIEMEERGIVFCTPEYPLFGEPYAVPNNTTWEDLESWQVNK